MPEYGTLTAAVTDFLSKHLSEATDHFVSSKAVLERTNEGRMAQRMIDEHNKIYRQGMTEDLQKELQLRHSGQLDTPINLRAISNKNQQRARYAVGGPMDANWVTLARSVQNRHGEAAARSFSNAVSMNLRDYMNPAAHIDTTTYQGFYQGKKAAGMSAYSPLLAHIKMGGVAIKDTRPIYTPRGEGRFGGPLEHVSGALHSAMAPLAAIAHLGTPVNLLLGTDSKTFLKSTAEAMTFQLGQKIDATEAMYHTGAFAEHYVDAVDKWNKFHATGNNAWIKGTAGEFLYKFYHAPGFRPVRDYTLLMGVNAARQTAEDAALKFARSGGKDKELELALRNMNLDPKQVLQNQGQLSQYMLESAIYKFVDQHAFLDNAMHRSAFFQGTPLGRTLGMYHSYVTRQAKLMIKSLTDGFRGQGLIHTVRNLAILATVFPTVGEFIKLAQESVRGQDSVGDFQKDLENISGQNDTSEALKTYLEALGHVGAFGMYDYLLRGGYTRASITEFAGPVFGTITNTSQDITKLATHALEGKVDSENVGKEVTPVARDLFYTIPGLSTLNYVLGHRILPRKYEHPEDSVENRLWDYFHSSDGDNKHNSGDSKNKKKQDLNFQ